MSSPKSSFSCGFRAATLWWMAVTRWAPLAGGGNYVNCVADFSQWSRSHTAPFILNDPFQITVSHGVLADVISSNKTGHPLRITAVSYPQLTFPSHCAVTFPFPFPWGIVEKHVPHYQAGFRLQLGNLSSAVHDSVHVRGNQKSPCITEILVLSLRIEPWPPGWHSTIDLHQSGRNRTILIVLQYFNILPHVYVTIF